MALTGPLLVDMLGRGTAEVERHTAAINALNVFPVPDGDTGTNMALTLKAALEQAQAAEAGALSLAAAAKHIARGVLLGARGNSGVILSQFLRGFAEGVAGKSTAGPRDLAHALEQATAFAYRAVIKPVEGTMLTVGHAASRAARTAADKGGDLTDVLQAAADGAAEALAKTPEQLPVLKRAGVVDAGGKGLLCFLQGVLAACRRNAHAVDVDLDEPAPKTTPSAAGAEDSFIPGEALADLHRHLDPSEITYRYCTEFLIRGTDLSPDTIRSRLLDLGDSLLVVGDDEVVKVHLHTEHPGRALEVGVSWGDLLNISIDNMREQQQHVAARMHRAPQDQRPDDQAEGQEQSLGVVAVAQGDGWRQLLTSLGVDQIVSGGQTMNPSAAELLEAIEAVGTPAVIVLPNNSNVVFAARQAQQLSSRDVHVVETTSPAAGVAAMLAFNPLQSASDATRAMEQALTRVRTAEVACAIRDSEGWGTGIKVGDRLGIVEGDIKVVAADMEEAALKSLDHLLAEDGSFVSIYYGDDVQARDAERLAEAVRNAWPECEVELLWGGQPVYSYVLSVE